MSEPAQNIFERVLLRPVEPDGPGAAHLSWRADGLGGRVVQVYLDGRLHDAAPPGRREMWLHLDRVSDHRVELLAVEPGEAWADHADRLAGWSPAFTTEASLAMVRDESLPVDARVVVSVDGAADAGHPLWGPGDARGGFGGLFGEGAFGYGLTSGPGLGLGEFGLGPMGADGAAWRWRRDDLKPGTHTLGLHVEDAAGRVVGGPIEPGAIMIDATPRPARGLSIGDDFTLRWA